jgi:hypothetical protein
MPRPPLATIVLLCLAASRCTQVPVETMRIDGRIVTVDNHTADDWRDVEIWVNGYFRATAPAIAAHGRLQVPLNGFVSGYAQRFDAKRLPVRELRLTAKRRDGTLVEHRKDFAKSAVSALSDRGER